ncbi:MAG TPA: hypothetical protein VF665_17600 [Longimicrobium sp.]|jgi:hypothetical protein|uniref:hypothetical protein n=1 Tax=Longimicrobium sp. TaxID=2029185 RepID=UPI002ED8EF6E
MRKLLWVDCIAGALAGAVMLLLGGWLSNLYALPRGLLFFFAAANLLYASYSFSLAVRSTRPRPLINLLVFANLAWAGFCLFCAIRFSGTATVWGVGNLLAEALFVGGLACLEWTQRNQLLTAS